MKPPCTNGQVILCSAIVFFAALQRLSRGGGRSCGESRRAGDITRDGFGGGAFAKTVRAKDGGSGFPFRGFGGDESAFLLTNEGQFLVLPIPIDANKVADAHLLRSEEVGQWIDDVTLDGAFQMAGAVALVGAFLQKKIAASVGDVEEEFAVGGVQDALLDHAQLDLENLLELLAL